MSSNEHWETAYWAEPIVGLPATAPDIDAYLAAWSQMISEVSAP